MRERFVKGRNERHITGSLGTLAAGMHLQCPPFCSPSISAGLLSAAKPELRASTSLLASGRSTVNTLTTTSLVTSKFLWRGPQLHHFAHSQDFGVGFLKMGMGTVIL